jgi:hypothetical protein
VQRKQNFAISHTHHRFLLLFLPFHFLPASTLHPVTSHTMFSRAVRISRAAPLRAAPRAQAASIVARRTVTTNAASAEVDKSSIPQVSAGAGGSGVLGVNTSGALVCEVSGLWRAGLGLGEELALY